MMVAVKEQFPKRIGEIRYKIVPSCHDDSDGNNDDSEVYLLYALLEAFVYGKERATIACEFSIISFFFRTLIWRCRNPFGLLNARKNGAHVAHATGEASQTIWLEKVRYWSGTLASAGVAICAQGEEKYLELDGESYMGAGCVTRRMKGKTSSVTLGLNPVPRSILAAWKLERLSLSVMGRKTYMWTASLLQPLMPLVVVPAPYQGVYRRGLVSWGVGIMWGNAFGDGQSPPKRPPTKPSAADTDGTVAHPDSLETDPDPSATTHCTKPHSSASRLVQYALMLDAGSTGSRIHIYKFNNCGPSPAYEWEVFKQTAQVPGGSGLSSFAGRPAAAADSLNILLDEAVHVVPASLQACTPIALKATAGLRRLPGSQAKDILDTVEKHLREKYPFALADKGAVEIMDGADEGVFAWVTANYLLDALPLTHPGEKAPATHAVLDLGGASTQIVFAPAHDAPLLEGEHKYELEFAGKTRVLYQHSYLGYGLMTARASVHRVVDFMAALHSTAPHPTDESMPRIANPCISRGTERRVELVDGGKNPGKRNVTMDGADVGSFEACRKVVDLVLAKDAVCASRPCSFGGVYQPTLADAFPAKAGRVLLLSYFYDRMAPLLYPASAEKDAEAPEEVKATVDAIAKFAGTVCKGREAWLEHWGSHAALMKELEDRPEWCLDLTFQHALLRTGYEFDGDREVMFGKKIAGTELGWCLGAGIKLVGGVDVQCRNLHSRGLLLLVNGNNIWLWML
ncbi:nucleoside phosphatase family-domain-containing protein [Favolaschia claudopus]|uniref:guanosine-diphosphatase n=1 Tax=Favolaschia claudopus TaxID=2862362 RepID=A0AAW0A445_9AGAR